MNELTSLSVAEMRSGLLSKQFSCVELVDAHLSRIEATNEVLNSFITISSELARSAAQNADSVIAQSGEESPPLTGIPVAVKDMLVTEGIETTCASQILKGFIPPYQCTAVSRMCKRGAVIVGKTNLDEFAMGASNENSSFGPVRNPWDTKRVPGGSSGGSAAAVSAGQAPLALGTDTGGSIRQPASLTGIVGLKPTYGRVSRFGAVAFASSLDQIGPFARSVEDLAVLLQAIAGKDERDSTSVDEPVPNYSEAIAKGENEALSKLRVGVPKEYFIDGMDPAVEDSVRKSLGVLEKLGATLVDVSLPHTELAIPTYYILNPAEASSNLARYDGVRYGLREPADSLQEMYARTRAKGFGPEVKRRIMIGTYVLSAGYYDAYYLKAQQIRTLIINDFKAAFANDCDVIAAPVSPSTAFAIGEKADSPLQMYLADVFTCPINLAGLPGMSVPCGSDADGLPIGLQFIGKPFDESTLLRCGHAFFKQSSFDIRSMARKQATEFAI
ncbi:MAG: Asp-tRNA(Asn)/Glu-tRNA(Gln) amidotransferase subunit GatA [Bdellovibrionales bacterium]|nr:Asp-tRNA(Asn)/Glu-tRNA(Gln) amidotransferase subunit GatA [Bdellovibrionales bacterium]